MALPQLAQLGALALLVLTVFAVLGLNVLGGRLRMRCYRTEGDFWEVRYKEIGMLTWTDV
eukprot:12359-Eustigmatos_ZCMA.PRE.1